MVDWVRRMLWKGRRRPPANPYYGEPITPSMVEIHEEYRRAMAVAKRETIRRHEEAMRALREADERT